MKCISHEFVSHTNLSRLFKSLSGLNLHLDKEVWEESLPFLIIPNYATNSQVVRKSVKHDKIKLNQYCDEGKLAVLNYSQLCHKLSQSC